MTTGHHFEIYDERHAEHQSDQGSFGAALAELERLAGIPWNEEPNKAPCMSWKTCGRSYELIEYDPTTTPATTVRHVLALEISAKGVEWDPQFPRDERGT